MLNKKQPWPSIADNIFLQSCEAGAERSWLIQKSGRRFGDFGEHHGKDNCVFVHDLRFEKLQQVAIFYHIPELLGEIILNVLLNLR